MSSRRLYFFTSKEVLKAADKQTRAVLSKFGAFVRRTARTLIRKGKKPSQPGKPPHDRGGPLKRLLWFFYDIKAKSVVIGPAKINGAVSPNEPEALEKGGKTKVLEQPDKKHSRARRATRVITIKPRPYMGPAVAKEKKTLPRMWANSVRSG